MENQVSIINAYLNEKNQRKASSKGQDSTRGFVLQFLFEHDGEATPSALFNVMDVTKPRITAILDALEKDRLVKREQSPIDKRAVLVRITEKGKLIVTMHQDKQKKKIESLLKVLGPDDAAACIRIIEVMRELKF